MFMDAAEKRARMAQSGLWLRATRTKRGYETASEFARALGIDPSMVSNYETGKNEVSDDRAERIARVLRMDIITVRRHLGLWVPPDDGQTPPTLTLQDVPTDDLFQELERRFAEQEVRKPNAVKP